MTWINNYKEAIKDFDFDKYFATKVDVKEELGELFNNQ